MVEQKTSKRSGRKVRARNTSRSADRHGGRDPAPPSAPEPPAEPETPSEDESEFDPIPSKCFPTPDALKEMNRWRHEQSAFLNDYDACEVSIVVPVSPEQITQGHAFIHSRLIIGKRGTFERVAAAVDKIADAHGEPEREREPEQRGGVSISVLWRASESTEAIAEYRGERADTGAHAHERSRLGGMLGHDTCHLDLTIMPEGINEGMTRIQRLAVCGPFGTIERFAKHIEAAAVAFADNGNAGAFSLECGKRDPRPIAAYRAKHADRIGGSDIAYVKLFTRPDGWEDCEQAFESHTLTGPRGMIESLSRRLVEFLRDFATEGGEPPEAGEREPETESARHDAAARAAAIERLEEATQNMPLNYVIGLANRAELRAAGITPKRPDCIPGHSECVEREPGTDSGAPTLLEPATAPAHSVNVAASASRFVAIDKIVSILRTADAAFVDRLLAQLEKRPEAIQPEHAERDNAAVLAAIDGFLKRFASTVSRELRELMCVELAKMFGVEIPESVAAHGDDAVPAARAG